jgi:hypothetical protein
MQRCLDEAKGLDLTPEVLDAWLYGNAETFFGGARVEPGSAPHTRHETAQERR